jgi:ribose-phosphate pyrophosphokinase
VPGPASKKLSQKIADLIEVKTISIEYKAFIDGESYIRFKGDLKEENVVIIQTTSPPQNTNLIQLFLMLDAAKDMGAKEIIAVIPYLAYSRQDKRFLSGEAFSFKTIMSLLNACGLNKIITINFHNPEVIKDFEPKIKDLSAINLLAEYLKKIGFNKATSLSLGKKAIKMATQASNILKGKHDYLETRRDRLTGEVEIKSKSLMVENQDVVIFDDIISSGGTMVKAVKFVKSQGARRLYVACIHPLLIGNAKNNIMKGGAEGIIGTDCVPSSVSKVSVAPLIARKLKDF